MGNVIPRWLHDYIVYCAHKQMLQNAEQLHWFLSYTEDKQLFERDRKFVIGLVYHAIQV